MDTKIHWLIEEDAFDEGSSDSIVAVLKEQGVPYKILKPIDYYEERYNHFPHGDCVFFYGSVNVAKIIHERQYWKPGIIGDFPKYRCSSFYSQLGDKMLSSDYFFAPFGDLKRLWPFYQQCLSSECLFLRPDGGDKMFAGQVVEDMDAFFAKEYGYLQEFSTHDAMCLIASAYKIDAEYRLLISSGKIATGSRYRLNGHAHRDNEIPEKVVHFVNEILSEGFAPDDVFILDVCESGGKIFCLEINPVSCAGLYKIDPEIFVNTINEAIVMRNY